MDLNSLLLKIMVFCFALFCFVMDQKPDCILTRLSIASIHNNFSMERLKKNPKHLLCYISPNLRALYLLECLRLEYQLNSIFKTVCGQE